LSPHLGLISFNSGSQENGGHLPPINQSINQFFIKKQTNRC